MPVVVPPHFPALVPPLPVSISSFQLTGTDPQLLLRIWGHPALSVHLMLTSSVDLSSHSPIPMSEENLVSFLINPVSEAEVDSQADRRNMLFA